MLDFSAQYILSSKYVYQFCSRIAYCSEGFVCLLGCNAIQSVELMTFRRNMSPPSSGLKNKAIKKPWSKHQAKIHDSFFCGLFFNPEVGGDMLHRNACWLYSVLHGVVCWKMEHFITIAVRTSNPTYYSVTNCCSLLFSASSKFSSVSGVRCGIRSLHNHSKT
jgi:hypothetical protein